MCKSYSYFFSKQFQYICISLDVNFNESLTNDIVSFEQLGPAHYSKVIIIATSLGTNAVVVKRVHPILQCDALHAYDICF